MKVRHDDNFREVITDPGQFDLEFYKSYNYEESK